MPTLVKEIMQQPVVTMALPATVADVRDLMTQKDCHAIPLVEMEDGRVISIRGIVSSDDLLGVNDDAVGAQQVMTRSIHSVPVECSVGEAAALMLRHRIHHLLVMEREKIMGIVSSMDFVRLVAQGGTT